MKVNCEIEEITISGDHSDEVPSTRARCTRCDHETESFGTSDRSVKRCLVLMREECPQGEDNFYVSENDT